MTAVRNRLPRFSGIRNRLPRVPRIPLLLPLLVLIFLKLWLVRHDEVVALDFAYDDTWYLTSGTHGYWFDRDGNTAFLRQPGYPLWISLGAQTGVPLRTATEILFLGAALVFVLALRRVGVPGPLLVLVFAMIAFHPFSFFVNRHVMSDSFYAPVLLLALAGMVMILLEGRKGPYAILTGLALAVLWHTRPEHLVIILYLGLLGACAAWVRAARGLGVRRSVREAGLIVLVPTAIVAASALTIRAINYRVFGVFADYELAMPGFRGAYGALLGIVPDPPLRFIPAPREVRQRAYAVSPTFRLLKPYFEGPASAGWKLHTERVLGVRNEIGAGWFSWALATAVRWAGYGSSPADMETFYRRMAAEIEAGCDDGRLECRAPILGPVDPSLRNYVSHLPASFHDLVKLLVAPGGERRRASPGEVRPHVLDLFNAAANRRTALIRKEVVLGGWAANLSDPVRRVAFRDSGGDVVAFTDALASRPGLDAYFRSRRGERTAEPLPAAFQLAIPFPADGEWQGDLEFVLESGAVVRLAWSEIARIRLGHIFTTDGKSSPPLEYAIETREGLPDGNAGPAQALEQILFGFYGQALSGLLVLALASTVVTVARRPRTRLEGTLAGVVVLLTGVIVVRLALFALIDASAWPGNDPRYLFPVAYLLPCLALLLTYGSVRRLALQEGIDPSRPLLS